MVDTMRGLSEIELHQIGGGGTTLNNFFTQWGWGSGLYPGSITSGNTTYLITANNSLGGGGGGGGMPGMLQA
jgi:hypothetical protein